MQSAKTLLVAGALVLACAGWAQAQGAAAQPPSVPASNAPATPAAAQPTDSMNASVTTVGELLKVENQLALKQAMKARVEAGLAAPDVPMQIKGAKLPAPPAPTVLVDSIFGVGNSLRANLTVGADSFENVAPGSRVQGCEIERIESRCVVMRPARKIGARAACSTVCWTGVRALAPVALGAGSRPGAAGEPPIPAGGPGMPLPVPTSGAASQFSVPVAQPAAVPAH